MNLNFSNEELEEEAKRLFSKLKHVHYTLVDCRSISHLTLEIQKLKKEKNFVILAHNYQRAEVVFGVGDFNGDSLGLSIEATKTNAKNILFAGVKFMAETAKILNPEKRVFIPDLNAGCSLAESISVFALKKLKSQYPKAAVVCYVNTDAVIKAESDICCTSANVLQVVESLPNEQIIFIPDNFMAKNLRNLTSKKIIEWSGTCVVHEIFTVEQVKQYKKLYPGLKVLSHLECSPEVIQESDFAGGTSGMQKFVSKSDAKQFLLVTECGMADVLRVEFPEKEFVTPCSVCPFMKTISLENILQTLREEKFEITIEEKIRLKAKQAVDKMLELKK